MPESLGPSRIIIINSKRLYHPIRDIRRPELRIPPYIAIHSPVHPCRDFPKIFHQKIPVKYPRPPAEMAPKFSEKIAKKSLSALHRNPAKRRNPSKGRIRQKGEKCNTPQNFSQIFFFAKFFSKIFRKIFSAKTPEIQHCKEFFTKIFSQNFYKFFTKFLGATYSAFPHEFLTKYPEESPETPVCDDEDDVAKRFTIALSFPILSKR